MWPGLWFIHLGMGHGCSFMVPETISKKLRHGFVFLFYNRLGHFFNIKMETRGLGQDMITLLHVWAMENSTRQFLLVEVLTMNW